MLTIKPIPTLDKQKEILAKCGITYRDNHFAYQAYEGDELIAAAQFDILGETAQIDAMRQVIDSKDDFEAMFILGRAVLNFLDLCGVCTAIYPSDKPDEQRLAKLLGFKDLNGVPTISLAGLFDAHCSSGSGCTL
ncbi:MAG: hypothetical protein E7618_04075 [Ruminococcaceae bacterium]|nr:hypothetical protein [Oscillospiraceae bacterium]